MNKGHMYAFVMDSNFRTNFQPVQQGDMLFRYSVTTHKGGWRQGRCRDFGWSVANPLMPVVMNGKRKGTLPATASFCQVDKPNVFLLTLKQAEDGDGLIVRLIETDGQKVTAKVTQPHLTIKKAWRTNLVEENQVELTYTEHSVTVPVNAFGISTVRVETP
jgi:alpha-mannosidase